jgi:divalent metal cation (Fe/Co/Zn/Cd) transporter
MDVSKRTEVTFFRKIHQSLSKGAWFRKVIRVGDETGGNAVQPDAWHRSDAITSAAPIVGIGKALWDVPSWESAENWASLLLQR